MPLFLMKVNIGEGKKIGIKFWKDDDPEEKARGFCLRYNLEETAVGYLTKLLRKRKTDSLKSYKAPNALLKSIVPPEKPQGDDVDYTNQNFFKQGDYIEKENIDNFNDIEDENDLRGSQDAQFKELVKKKLESVKMNTDDNVIDDLNEEDLKINAGLKIHMKGIKCHEREIRRARKKIKTKEEKEIEKCTFRPKLNKNSMRIVQNKSYLSVDGKRDLDLYSQAAWRQEKKAQLKSIYETEKYADCTFSPRINQISDKIVSYKRGGSSNGNNIHVSLFNEFKDRIERQEKLEKEILKKACSFKPNLEKTKKYKSHRINNKKFIERNKDYVREKNKKLEMKKKMMNEYDRVDGERLFSPRLINNIERKRDKPIEDHLIAYKKYYEDNKRSRLEYMIRHEQDQGRLQLCEKSNEILANSFVGNLTRMFQLLDERNNEQLCPGNYKVENIEDPQLKIFALQIGAEIEENNLALDMAEFVEIGMQVFQNSDLPVKNAMLANRSKRTQGSMEFTFMPKISKKSKAIAMGLDRDVRAQGRIGKTYGFSERTSQVPSHMSRSRDPSRSEIMNI